MSVPEPLPDCYEGDPDLLPPGEAMRRIRAHVRPVEATETVAVIDALGRVAARDAVSPMDVPGHTNSAMDGYACAGDSLPDDAPRWYEVVGTAWAGRPFAGPVGPSQAVRIMTGAVMPAGADTVVRPLASEFAKVLKAGYLRGADLWHVATALYAARQPSEIWFVTLDRKQHTIAAALGFQVADQGRR